MDYIFKCLRVSILIYTSEHKYIHMYIPIHINTYHLLYVCIGIYVYIHNIYVYM